MLYLFKNRSKKRPLFRKAVKIDCKKSTENYNNQKYQIGIWDFHMNQQIILYTTNSFIKAYIKTKTMCKHYNIVFFTKQIKMDTEELINE